jgi:hypothetical protein
MKYEARSVFIFGLVASFFLIVAATVDFGPLLRFYSDYDLTPYLVARSIASDFDLTYTQTDSDRFFREQLVRPSRFFLKSKNIVSYAGGVERYLVFYDPDLYVFLLVPFVKLFSFHGVFVLQALLIAAIVLLGALHFQDARNAVVYYLLAGVPLLFLIPSHHLFLLASVSASIFCAFRKRFAMSAIFLAIAVSSQFWSILLAPLFLHYWKTTGEEAGKELRFIFFLAICALVVWGIEYGMYPARSVTETRWVLDLPQQPLQQVWSQLPVFEPKLLTMPKLQRLSDFVFGRTVGIFLYGFPACAMLLAAVWQWKHEFVRSALLFVVLLVCAIAFSDPLYWNIRVFATDFLILLLAVAFYVFPMFSSRTLLLGVLIPSLLIAAPVLANPLGAVCDRYYYLQTFPYRFFPVELSLLGKVGRTAKPDYKLSLNGATVYFLNDSFYHEENFFWIRGESTAEILLEIDFRNPLAFHIQTGSVDDHVIITMGSRREDVFLAPNESADVKLEKFRGEMKEFQGRQFLHGKIESKNGYAPKLLSRDNPDYRYLGCQIHLIALPLK